MCVKNAQSSEFAEYFDLNKNFGFIVMNIEN